MKIEALISAYSPHENILAANFRSRIQADHNRFPEHLISERWDKMKDPDIILEMCDYRCSVEKCLRKFRAISRWPHVPKVFLRPILGPYPEMAPPYFLISRYGRIDKGMNSIEEWLYQLETSPFIACSPSWRVHRINPLFKISHVQKIIIESSNPLNNLSSLANAVNWTPSWLSHSFKKQTGINLERFLIKIKMCNALWQLVVTDKLIKTLSYAIGYKDPLYFSKAFKKHFNISPEYVRRFFEH